MRREIDRKTWYRKDHFEFFSQFDEPFFGITAKIDCTGAYQTAKENDFSFFLFYLHKSLEAANRVASFRYRIEGEKVFEYEVVNASPTINRADGSFGFSYMEYKEDFEAFASLARREMEKVRNEKGLKDDRNKQKVLHACLSSCPSRPDGWIPRRAVPGTVSKPDE